MPPLCTAGYGLAVGNLSYFLGAMFLFSINTIFIALATFVIVKFLDFPMVKYINSSKRKRVARLASTIALLVFAGSIYMFINLYRENSFKQHAQELINDIKKSGISIIDEEAKNINYTDKTVQIYVYGNKLSAEEIEKWNSKLPEYGLENTNLKIQQGVDDSDLRHEVQNLSELYIQNHKIISSRDESIKEKEEKIKILESELSKYYSSQIPFIQISEEAKANYNGLKQISYGQIIETNFNKIDTLTVFNTKWHDSIPKSKEQRVLLQKWLKIRLNQENILVN